MRTLPDFRKYNWFGAHGEGCTHFLEKRTRDYKDPISILNVKRNAQSE
jgi:hypothetical protein